MDFNPLEQWNRLVLTRSASAFLLARIVFFNSHSKKNRPHNSEAVAYLLLNLAGQRLINGFTWRSTE